AKADDDQQGEREAQAHQRAGLKMAGPGRSEVCGCWHEGVHLCEDLMRWRVEMQNDPDWEPENIRLVQRNPRTAQLS
ncbi:hypothetical protein A249_16351, partial [Pseudomonas syringae pv. actinidiae ICMP 18804]